MITLTVVVLLETGAVVGLIGGAVLRNLYRIHRLQSDTPHAPVIMGRSARKWVIRSSTTIWRITDSPHQQRSLPILKEVRSRSRTRLHLVPRDSPHDHFSK